MAETKCSLGTSTEPILQFPNSYGTFLLEKYSNILKYLFSFLKTSLQINRKNIPINTGGQNSLQDSMVFVQKVDERHQGDIVVSI